MEASYQPGLENVMACETSISYLDVEHEEIVLRGYDLIELAKSVGYLDVVELLLDGALPTVTRGPGQRSATGLEQRLKAEYAIPPNVFSMLGLLPPTANLMDTLRTGLSAFAAFDAELEDLSPEAEYRKSIRLLATVPQIVANGYRLVTQQTVLPPRTDLSFVSNFLYMITGREPTPMEEAIFNQSLIAYSEHEMPNSTFAARVISSTNADMYGALTGAVASLKGTLHGGANEAVMEMLLEAGSSKAVEKLMLDKLAHRERIMGFGHRVYMKKFDPRALLMKEALATMAENQPEPVAGLAIGDARELLKMCIIGEEVMRREKGLFPNLDYYAAPVYYLLGIPIPLFTPVFFAARTAGLCAHVMEQHANNRLFRPRVRYTGPRGLHPKQGEDVAQSS